MKYLESRVLWGVLLIAAGIVFLLDNLNILPLGDVFWLAVLVLGGAFFLSIVIQNRSHWWALIPGITLLSVATLIALDQFLPALGNLLGGTVILGGIGLSFILIYLLDRQQWWAIIPFGVMTTLAMIAGLDELFPRLDTGGLLFIGFGLTFALLALLPTSEGRMRWAWIPAAALTAFGIIIMAAAGDLLPYIWPAVLIVAGLVLVVRNLLPRSDRM